MLFSEKYTISPVTRNNALSVHSRSIITFTLAKAWIIVQTAERKILWGRKIPREGVDVVAQRGKVRV